MTHTTNQQKKILILASLGGMLEFYDFTIYGFFSVYFAAQFFPNHDHFVAIIASYSIFALGYLARPIGGILFSHIGDEVGRKLVMIITMLVMGGTSIGIGVLPTYAQIGAYAPLLLLLLRFSQGLALGGEIPSAVVFVSESMPQKSAYAIGSVMAGVGGGLILGTLINALLSTFLSSAQLYNFGWRIPFIFGGLLCAISYLVRRKLHETKAFSAIQERPKFPLLDLLRKQPQLVLIGSALGAIGGASTMLILIFMPTYLSEITKTAPQNLAELLLAANIVMTIATYLSGILANRYPQVRVMQYGLFLAIAIVAGSYYLIAKNNHLSLALISLSLLPGFFAALAPLLMSKLFPATVRLTGLALSYNLGHTIFGGLAPIIVTGLIEKFGYPALVPAGYLILVCLIAFSATGFLSRRNCH